MWNLRTTGDIHKYGSKLLVPLFYEDLSSRSLPRLMSEIFLRCLQDPGHRDPSLLRSSPLPAPRSYKPLPLVPAGPQPARWTHAACTHARRFNRAHFSQLLATTLPLLGFQPPQSDLAVILLCLVLRQLHLRLSC